MELKKTICVLYLLLLTAITFSEKEGKLVDNANTTDPLENKVLGLKVCLSVWADPLICNLFMIALRIRIDAAGRLETLDTMRVGGSTGLQVPEALADADAFAGRIADLCTDRNAVAA